MKNLMIWILILISLILFSCGESKLDRDEREACENKPGTWDVSSEFYRSGSPVGPIEFKIFLNEAILNEGIIESDTNNIRWIPIGTAAALGDRIKIELITPGAKGILFFYVQQDYWFYNILYDLNRCQVFSKRDVSSTEISGPTAFEYTIVDLR